MIKSAYATIKALDVNIDPNNSSKYVAGLANGTALYSTDGGLTWTGAPAANPEARVQGDDVVVHVRRDVRIVAQCRD